MSPRGFRNTILGILCIVFLLAADMAHLSTARAEAAPRSGVGSKAKAKLVKKKKAKKSRRAKKAKLLVVQNVAPVVPTPETLNAAPATESNIDGLVDSCPHQGPANAFKITNVQGLHYAGNAVLSQPGGYAVLCADLDFAQQSSRTVLSVMRGTLDGNGYVIRNRHVSASNTQFGPLFVEVAEGGVIRNLSIEDSELSIIDYGVPAEPLSATLVAERNFGTISNVRIARATVSSLTLPGRPHRIRAAGVVNVNRGVIADVSIEEADVYGSQYVGGIASENYGSISNVTVQLNRLSTQAGGWVGGVAGIVHSGGSIQNAIVSIARMSSNASTPSTTVLRSGGIAGSSLGSISDSFVGFGEFKCRSGSCGGAVGHFGGAAESMLTRVAADGRMVCEDCAYLGGLVGRSFYGKAYDTSFRGEIELRSPWSGGAFGGAFGHSLNTDIRRGVSFAWIAPYSPITGTVGGYMGQASNTTTFRLFFDSDLAQMTATARGTPLRSSEAMQQSSYENFDFVNTWSQSAYSYPTLRGRQ